MPHISDHCSVEVSIRTKYFCCDSLSNEYQFITKPKRVHWSSDVANTFERLLQNQNSKSFLGQLVKQSVSSQSLLDTAVDSLSSFLVGAAEQSAGPTLRGNNPHVSRRSEDRNWKYRKRSPRVNTPKWFDITCETLQRQLRVTTRLLKLQPSNPYLKGKLFTECKEYKRLRQFKKRQYVESMFVQLDQMHSSNPKGYMDLVRSLRDGSFDKKVADTSSHISPDSWREHFRGLLGSDVPQTPTEVELTAFLDQNCDSAKSCLDEPLTRSELLIAISALKNNKAISFDRVSNEMLKSSKLIITNQLLFLFNNILSQSIYPSAWKKSILTPLHKSKDLTDPNNFRGVAVSSCLGKLFNKLLNIRLENKCISEGLISECQGSGKKGSRTADHLLIIRFLIDKYVNTSGKKLFACFFDIRRAYDSVPQNLMFFKLLNDYKIGGNYLKIIRKMYADNKIYIKLSDGICEPFVSTRGILQGETSSPLLFNLFINNISKVFDQSCDSVLVNNTEQSRLLWSDDLFCISQTAEGLQNTIDKVTSFYSSLGLQLHSQKTKVLIFNKVGKQIKGHTFLLDGAQLEVTDSYQYLGIKLRPSGSFTAASEELCIKARKAWFSISNIIYKDKSISVERAFHLFDSLVSPVALYGCEAWYPHVLPKNCFQSKTKLISSWETLKAETINQFCSRILLSVHRKASRLAVLGELGRHPLAVKAMAHTLNYRLCLAAKPDSSLIGQAMAEMKVMAQNGVDCWLSRVDKMANLLQSPVTKFGPTSGRQLLRCVKCKFNRYWADTIKAERIGADGLGHNKLQTYSSFKCQFSQEPYLSLVRNRNQRCHLSRLRVSAHRLGCETMRYSRPPVPRDQRFCVFCPLQPGPGGQLVRPVDDECHCVTLCTVGMEARAVMYRTVTSTNNNFVNLCNVDKFKTLVCPTSANNCTAINVFLGKHFTERQNINMGIIP